MVSLFQLKESEECYQELLKTKSKLEIDISIKANSMFIDSEGCMQCRRLFPAVRLQPTSDIFCAVLNAKVPGWDSSSNVIHSQPPAIFINKKQCTFTVIACYNTHQQIRILQIHIGIFVSVGASRGMPSKTA